MKYHLFDQFVRTKFESYRPEVSPQVWQNIEAANRKRPPSGLLYYRFTAAATVLLLLSLSVAVFFAGHRRAGNNNFVAAAKHAATGSTLRSDETAAAAAPSQTMDDKTGVTTVSTDGPAKSPAAASGADAGSALRANVPGDMFVEMASAQDVVAPTARTENLRTTTPVTEHQFLAGLLNGNKTNLPLFTTHLLPKRLIIPCPPAERNTAGNKRYAELYLSPDYVIRTVTDAADAGYAAQRKAASTPSFSYSAGARYTRVFRNGLSIRAGLNYSRVNENFRLVNGHVSHNVYITDNAGDTTGTYSVSGTRYTQNTNKFTSLDIPIAAGYEAGNGRLHTNVNAGVMINIVNRASGYTVDAAGDAVDISSGKTSTVYNYRTNTGLSLTGAVSLYYKLNDAFHLLAEPYVRYSLSPATRQEMALKQTYHTAGMRLGLRMDL